MFASRAMPVLAALTLIGCQMLTPAVSQMAEPSGTGSTAASNYTDLDNPTKAADMQGATILTVDRYRPTFRLKSCDPAQMEEAIPLGELKAAIEEARAYSIEHGGVGLIVMRNGELLHESYAEALDGSSPTASASMAKSVLALLFGIAIEEGLVGSIDDPIGDYLSEWEDDPRGAITLRQMLTMSSGLGSSDFMRILLAPDIGEVALETPLASEPGSVFNYNNAVSKLLAMVLDRRIAAAGRGDLQRFLHEELWCPLGNGEALLWVDQAGKMRGYAGLHAGLRDWARIGELIHNQGALGDAQIVPADWIAEMVKPSAANPQYGLQLWLAGAWTERRQYSATNPVTIYHSEPFVAQDLVYFDGFGGQRVYIIPSLGLTIARTGFVSREFDDSRIPNLISRALPN